jgi:hypothetical protein
MSTRAILESIQRSALAEWMRYSAAAPVIESTHVVAAVLLFGTVLVVDLRLLGLADSRQAFTRISHETLPLTWLAFGISVITGWLMFTASAQTYFGNTAFQLKALALCGAGLNMALFQLVTARRIAAWDQGTPAPRAARVAGVLSVLLWAAVVLLGRWIGFTKGYDFTIPPGIGLGFPIGPE